jgi:hypothetical protein
MRKLFTLLVITLLSAGIVSAQTTTKSGKKRWGHFGFKTGANFSSLRLEGVETTTANVDGKTGFVFGAFETIPLAEKFDLQFEFSYSAMGGTIATGIGSNDLYKLNYFSIPILLKYSFFDGVKLVGGPQLDFIIKAKRENGGYVYNHTDNVNSTSVAATFGVEKWFGKFINLQCRYIYGINDVNKTSKTFQYINKGFQATFGVLIQ